ncbi:MAG: hypothetical protein J6N76_06180, partial [Lachnospiraceae bacterium]|nr:hypothetical protein [Lachnospiraceae bacterium]
EALFNSRSENIFQRLAAAGVSIVYIIAICVIGCVIIYIIGKFLEHRRRIVYRIVAVEVLLFCVCASLTGFYLVHDQVVAEREYVRGQIYSLGNLAGLIPSDLGSEDFATSANYATLYNNMAAMTANSDVFSNVEDMCIVDAAGNIVMSLNGETYRPVGYVYGASALEACSSAEESAHISGYRHGEPIIFISRAIPGTSGFKILCVSVLMSSGEYIWHYGVSMIIMTLIIFVILSFAIGFLIDYDSNVLDKVSNALERLGNGEENIEVPEGIIGYDIRHIWASINEIRKNIRKANRFGYITYEAYYRFAPKSIETILGKNYISEVEIGDTRRLYGTVAYISIPASYSSINETAVDEKNRFFSIATKQGDRTNGIIVSTKSDLSAIRMLFMEDNRNSIRFGIDLSNEVRYNPAIPNSTIIVHYDRYMYGVVGTDQLSYTFLAADDMKKIEEYANWLGSLGIVMAITEPVKERENGSWDLRYIGFILPDPNDKLRRINFYEVLDADESESRRNKKRMENEFKEALDLFYEMDFYFARNAFTDILREAPEDDMTKWYLFECERLLNESALSDFVGELHFDRA